MAHDFWVQGEPCIHVFELNSFKIQWTLTYPDTFVPTLNFTITILHHFITVSKD